MVCEELVLRNPLGLHLRPAGVLCTEALRFSSKILIRYENREANAKSILGILSTGIKYQSRFEVVCEGEDEKEALVAIKKLFQEGLGEVLEDESLES